ncbi:NAD(P)H-dependent glycerol-3-phosphate dehydrogenase [Legionella gresilensis]|uniref:NAD(P)H-dependent glycerol-3-phosphate dehydrogenase n=1 Tax=Legionella gresilensis TaxID=91823 RepID=UPI0010412259|nr:NAD(P)H-dependent glycerol-3-phosphate dehydrogenase [Legionella gresilensis]
MKKNTIAILGAGSWGTAIAIHLAHYGNPVMLWGHSPEHIEEMQQSRQNSRYLPGVSFSDLISPTVSLATCLQEASFVIAAVPSHAFCELLNKLDKPMNGLAWLTKGLDPTTNYLLSDLVAKRWGQSYPIAVLSGPSFAKEVAHFLPTAVTLAGNNLDFQQKLQSLLHQQNLRVYLSTDIIGVQLCGAVKNVLAIACGISDGLGFGANAKAALITRGLAEMSRLGKHLGAREETFQGLAGVGDLVLTCTDNQSRNRRFGIQLGQGVSVESAEKAIGQVVEGKHNATQVCNLARQLQVEMPICVQVESLLKGEVTPAQAVSNLMNRSARNE